MTGISFLEWEIYSLERYFKSCDINNFAGTVIFCLWWWDRNFILATEILLFGQEFYSCDSNNLLVKVIFYLLQEFYSYIRKIFLVTGILFFWHEFYSFVRNFIHFNRNFSFDLGVLLVSQEIYWDDKNCILVIEAFLKAQTKILSARITVIIPPCLSWYL